MDASNIAEISGGLGAVGVLVWLVLYIFKTLLPKQRSDYLDSMKESRSDFTDALARQRSDFSKEMGAERKMTIKQSDQYAKTLAEQREDFGKTMQIVISNHPSLGGQGAADD
jgi:hypothetical protein